VAFIAYPVSDIKAARNFYEQELGLKLTHEAFGQWFEYDLGSATFAICQGDAEHPAPVRGAALAFEVSELSAEVNRLKGLKVKFKSDIGETPVCLMAVIYDPDGNELILHQRKRQTVPSTPEGPGLGK